MSNGQTVHVGESLTGTGYTEIVNTTTGQAGIIGRGMASGVSGTSVDGEGVLGESNSGAGVSGLSKDGPGVRGWALESGPGVSGSAHANGPGVVGYSLPNADGGPTPPAKTGVFGYAAQDSASVGVYGRTNLGTGVYGTSPNGQGMYGDTQGGAGVTGVSSTGEGVRALSNSGTAMLAKSSGGAAVLAECAGGEPAISAIAGTGDAIVGAAGSGRGVVAVSQEGTAIFGQNHTLLQPALIGRTPGSTGIQGYSGVGATPVASAATGVYGVADQGATSIGVLGDSDAGTGVYGTSAVGKGVYGNSFTGTGIYGLSNAPNAAATVGCSVGDSTGILGVSGTDTLPAAPAKTGVYGYADQDAAARGVTGQTTLGEGVHGDATSGTGTRGYAATGTGGYFSTSSPKVGTALHAVGKVAFDKSVGVATIAKGASTIVVTPGIDLTATSAVVATLMGSAGGTTAVRYVAVNATADRFTIHLTARATIAVKVAWHVFG